MVVVWPQPSNSYKTVVYTFNSSEKREAFFQEYIKLIESNANKLGSRPEIHFIASPNYVYKIT